MNWEDSDKPADAANAPAADSGMNSMPADDQAEGSEEKEEKEGDDETEEEEEVA